MKRIFSLFLIVVVGMVVGGCGKSPTAPGDGTPLSEKGDTQLNIGKIPDDFPTDVPVYINVKSSKAITGGVNLLHMLSDDSKAQILDFYKKELTAAKWQLTLERRNSREEILATKQQRSLTVSIVDKGTTGRAIDITY